MPTYLPGYNIRSSSRLRRFVQDTANTFLRPVFREAFVNTTGASLERVGLTEPSPVLQAAYQDAFARWRSQFESTELINA
ncbi:hypothetical protein [Spirosoma validum]|uniref:Uncharacterized protein n=1 Tax=Spirosoma validum TaxID=2771355 RepID=A0A927B6F4_9BACT|nr:hypothetical protein [Spirosoma validum]MBD2756315.1 hypothetical protein [Spirosoma validum]